MSVEKGRINKADRCFNYHNNPVNQRFWESKAREVELAKPRRGNPSTQQESDII